MVKLLFKCQGLSLSPQNVCKNLEAAMHICNPSAPMGRWETEAEKPLEAQGSASLVCTVLNERLRQTRWKTDMRFALLRAKDTLLTHVCLHSYT